MRSIRGPTQSSEKGTSGRIFERFSNLSLEFPICCTPDFDTAVVRLGCQKLPNWVPTNTFDEAVMLIDSAYPFLNRTKLSLQVERLLTMIQPAHPEYNHSRSTPGNPNLRKPNTDPLATMQGQSHRSHAPVTVSKVSNPRY